jgi:regulation of enolase protein 1 (concanavalin A-like superfamily)
MIEIDETFDGPEIDPRLRWWNPPPHVEIRDARLCLATAGGTDLWQRTHYGFRIDNAHCLLCERGRTDFVLTTELRFHPINQYDQSGLIVRLSSDCWLKTSVEFEPDGPNRLGVVVTNAGWSDWSTQDIPQAINALRLRVRREDADYFVEFAPVDQERPSWMQMRLTHLVEDLPGRSVQRGLYACSPKGPGYTTEFNFLRLERRRIG